MKPIYIIYAGLLVIAFICGSQIPMGKSKTYQLIQKQYGSIQIIERNLSVINCGLKKKYLPNSHCVQQIAKAIKTSRLSQ